MSDLTVNKPEKNSVFDNLIGPTDPNVDNSARERLVHARVSLLINHGFFGNMASNLKLVNSDEWLSTAATDGRNFYYNSRFIMMLQREEVEFLFAHEVMHNIYGHIWRREDRDPTISNIAADYSVNADLKRHNVGKFITTVPCLYEYKYDGMGYEAIYDDLMENADEMDLESLMNKMIDEHLDNKTNGGPENLSEAEKESIRQEIKQQLLAAAASVDAGNLPDGVKRLVQKITEPKMPWRDMISSDLTSVISTNSSWMKPSRRSWHIDAVLPGTVPGELIELAIALDMSGSITNKQASIFLSEVRGIMESFTNFRITVFCFDTAVYGAVDFDSDNLDTIDDYELVGGGGTNFDCIFDYLKSRDSVTKRLIVFTDMMPYGGWGDSTFCDTTWIGHGAYAKSVTPPFGTWAYFDEE